MGDAEYPLFKEPRAGAPRTQPVQGNALTRIAQATVGLAQVAPRLNELASARQAEAERQAARSKDVSALARQMSSALGHTVGTLRSASSEIAELTQLIRRIADQTSLIAINTGVAAARAGADGKVFAVLAQEIRLLSQNAAEAALDVENKVRRLKDSAESTAQVVGIQGVKRKKDATDLAWLLERMVEAEDSATRQAAEATELTQLGLRLRALSEDMIQSVGTFRLDANRRAEEVMEQLRSDERLWSREAAMQEQALLEAVDSAPYLELAYVTDARGIQTTENVAPSSFTARYGDTGERRDWSQRPWFKGAIATRGVFTSDIYRSAATDEFCLTISATFGPVRGRPEGVVALDVNFRQLLGE